MDNLVKKVCIVSINDSLGGAEQLLLKLANYYLAQSYKVTILFIKQPTGQTAWQHIENQHDNCTIVQYNGNYLKLISHFLKNKYDITMSSHLMVNATLGVLRSCGILHTQKLVARESTTVFDRFVGKKLAIYKLAYKIGYRKIDLLICQTTLMKAALIKNVPSLEKRIKIKVIPNPFDYPEHVDTIEKPFKYIVSAGRLIPEKGFENLILAFKKLSTHYTDLKLIILGQGVLLPTLEELVKKIDIEERVILEGFVADVYPYFKQAELCVVSSVKEGFPNVLLQMMSQNEKVVSTLCAGDIAAIEGIFISEANDIDALYMAMLTCLTTDTADRPRLFASQLQKRTTTSFVSQMEIELSA